MTTQMDWLVPAFCGAGLHFRLDGFRLIYVMIAVLMWAVSGVFSLEYMAHYKKKRRYYLFFWATFAATVGVFLSADLYTTFLFFEIMSFTSYVWVAFDEKKESLKAAETYLAVAVIGGLVMLMGLFLLYRLFGTLEMDELSGLAACVLSEGKECGAASHLSAGGHSIAVSGGFSSAKTQLYTAGGLLLFGFGAKAGMVPLHIWLPKAHPVAPAPASALLSGILTKAGVFGIIIVSCVMFGSDGGWNLMITVFGLVTMFLGALLALFSVNLKRTLACSSVSQIGFILTGIGMAGLLRAAGEGNLLAVRGAFLHMVNHSLIKLVLFLCAGAVYMNLHCLNLNDIRGFGRKKPALFFAFLMGALGIGGMPLWNGYVSKTLIHESMVEYIAVSGQNAFLWKSAEWLFLFTGGMTAAYMIKLFVCLFVDRHPQQQEKFDAMSSSYMTPLSSAALCGASILLPVLGCSPHLTMDRLADAGESFFMAQGHAHTVHYLAWINLKGGLISLLIGVLLYFFVVRKLFMNTKEKEEKSSLRYLNLWPEWLDLEELLYRPILTVVLPGIAGAVFEVLDRYFLQCLLQVFLMVSSFCTRVMDQTVDGAVLLARKTTHSQRAEKKYAVDVDFLALFIGTLADKGFGMLDYITGRRKRKGIRKSFVDPLHELEHSFKHLMRLIGESFSFGLMLFIIGFCATLLYLLYVYFR